MHTASPALAIHDVQRRPLADSTCQRPVRPLPGVDVRDWHLQAGRRHRRVPASKARAGLGWGLGERAPLSRHPPMPPARLACTAPNDGRSQRNGRNNVCVFMARLTSPEILSRPLMKAICRFSLPRLRST